MFVKFRFSCFPSKSGTQIFYCYSSARSLPLTSFLSTQGVSGLLVWLTRVGLIPTPEMDAGLDVGVGLIPAPVVDVGLDVASPPLAAPAYIC